MAEIKWSDNGALLHLTSDAPCTLDATELVRLVSSLGLLHHAMPLRKIDLERADEVPCYQFTLRTADDRTWSQCIRFVDGVRWDGEFEVTDYYTLAELMALRDVRDNLAVMLPRYGVDKLRARW